MTLKLPSRIGLIGDMHGDERALANAIIALADAGAELLVQLGDFGIIHDNTPAEWKALHRIDELLELVDLELVVAAGNHDPHPLIEALPLRDGLHRALVNVGYAPRGMRAVSPTGARYLFLSGAGSIDRYWRQARGTWFAGEEITREDIARIIADGPTDVILGHDAPTSAELTYRLSDWNHYWNEDGLEWALKMQARYDEIHRALRPRLTLSGHYHLNIDTTETFTGPAGAFRSRSVVLTRENYPGSIRLLHADDFRVYTVPLLAAEPRLKQFRTDTRAISNDEAEVAERLDIELRTLRLIRNGHIGLPTKLHAQARCFARLASERD